MIEDTNSYHNDIPELGRINSNRYENLFKIGRNNNYYFYNILKSVVFPPDIDPELYTEQIINSRRPYTTLSFQIYGVQDLWWLLCLVNNIRNPVQVITPGTKLKIIKPQYVEDVVKQIQRLKNA